MQLTTGEVATLLGSSCENAGRPVRGYSIDSRRIGRGELFFALHGPRFDGHDFVGQALELGAAGAVVEREFLERAGPLLRPFLIPVPNTLRALQNLARAVRRRWGGPLIAITGSVGKSTSKEMIATLLARRLRAHKSPGNLNNDYGLPLALLTLEPSHEVAVVELAMSALGEIARLSEIAEPEIGLVTSVAPVHLEFFESLDAIAQAKRELIEHLSSRRGPATAVLNYDDPRVRRLAEGFRGRVITFGFSPGADFRGINLRSDEAGGSVFGLAGPMGETEFRLSLPGRHNAQNALAALAVASLFEIPQADLREALAEFQNLHQRGEILTLPNGVTIIDDSYNSNPVAMERMLETLAAWPRGQRRIVVAGEMLELGILSPALHRDVGRKCARSGLAWLVAVQGDAHYFLEGAREEGFPAQQMTFFSNPQQAGEFCRAFLQPGDVVLVKGSRGVRMEKVIELLRSSSVAAATPQPTLRSEG